ncbi:MAG: acetylxylan esterase [Bacteroidota bacterium]
MYKYVGFAFFVISIYACVPTYEKVHEESLRQVEPKTIDLLRGFHGEVVRNSDDWEKWRRPEILSYYEQYVFGVRPEFEPRDFRKRKVKYNVLSVDTFYVHGVPILHKEIKARFSRRGRHLNAYYALFLPLDVKSPIVFVGLNFFGNSTIDTLKSLTQTKHYVMKNEGVKTKGHRVTENSSGTKAYRWPLDIIIGNGCGLITAHYADFDPDVNTGFFDGAHRLADGAIHFRKSNAWGSISAWSWGLSELQSYLQMEEVTRYSKTAVVGHSRLGKAALWAGALDARFDLVISNNSGCAGAAQFRTMVGEDVEKITNRFPYWFARNFQAFQGKDTLLLVDQEMLLALIAPRPLYVASANLDSWADPKGEYTSLYKAQFVYQLYYPEVQFEFNMLKKREQMEVGPLAYHLRDGDHEILAWDWERYVAFAKKSLSSPSN